MAIVSCPDCNHDVSDRAPHCPNCGYPMTPEPGSEEAALLARAEELRAAGLPEVARVAEGKARRGTVSVPQASSQAHRRTVSVPKSAAPPERNSGWWMDLKPWQLGLLVLSLVAVAVAVVLVSGGSSSSASQCERAPVGLVADIESGLNVDGGGSLTSVWGVRSNDYSQAYFVSGDIDGPGLEGDGPIGTWLVSGTLSDPGMFLSVNALAKEFSVFPDASKTDAGGTMADHGARESQDCG